MPDTLPDLMLGLVVIFGVLGLFLASVVVRQYNAQRTIRLIQQLEDES